MARLILKFDERVVHEYGLGLMVTIGRTPDNVVTIDNPAVSSHHACVFRDGDSFVLEDFGSTNGTYVNAQRVGRHVLRNGDAILIGKHTLAFDADGGAGQVDADGDEPTLAGLRDAVFIDRDQRQKLLARLAAARSTAPRQAASGDRPGTTAAPTPGAVLRVIAGRTDRPAYNLADRTSLIGRNATALVRLRGWLKPPVAAAITRNDEGYVATPIRGKTVVNGLRLAGRSALKHGDVLEISGVTLEFRFEPQ
jgi:pSer/pThr/pTyr-binding forkhead associated (FHA) protein